ncbi:MAG: SAM-dependent DNA methyltransferase [Chloroflexi bacterium]|nr:SAM-dependent DNA methyltransferase [Chloroflexota bacterium]
MSANITDIEKRLWDAADELRANSKLKSSEYSVPVLGLIFLRYADHKFALAERELVETCRRDVSTPRRRAIGKIDYQARGVLYLPDAARFSRLLALPEAADIGQAINDAMRAIEAENEALKDVLPKTYNRLDNRTLFALLKNFNSVPMAIEGDAFGKIYEYFLGKFAMSEGQKGGEFFTPTSIVKLIVEIIEPFGGRIFDPACGSGGMFVQSARFVTEHRRGASPAAGAGLPPPARAGLPTVPPPARAGLPTVPPPARAGLPTVPPPARAGLPTVPPTPVARAGLPTVPPGFLSIYGQEKVAETVRLCRMNLAVHGLEGDIKQGNSYYEDPHTACGKFDFVMTNPPFNVDKVDKERLADDPRFPFGLPKPDNANYLWIQLFYSSLNATGRAGFVMANSAADARGSELEIRRKLIEAGAVDVMVAVGPNFFYTVTLPCTLWFLDRGKTSPPVPSPARRGGDRADTVLFLDARHIYRQVDRAHREFTPEQIAFLAALVRLYRGEDLNGYTFDPSSLNLTPIQQAAVENAIRTTHYADIPGLCKIATRVEIAAQGWSLNPGRYVGVAERSDDDGDWREQLEALNEELEALNAEARELEGRIADNVIQLLEIGT